MKTYSKIINQKSMAILMISALTAISSQAQAGFLDSLSSVRDSISSIGHTANTITNISIKLNVNPKFDINTSLVIPGGLNEFIAIGIKIISPISTASNLYANDFLLYL